MKLRIESNLRPSFESLGALVLLKQKLAEAGLYHSVLNVQDYGKGSRDTEGVVVGRVLDKGFALTLQDFPDGTRFNCTLRDLDGAWDGRAAAQKLSTALKDAVHRDVLKLTYSRESRPGHASASAAAVATARRNVKVLKEVQATQPEVPSLYVAELLAELRTQFPGGFASGDSLRMCIKSTLKNASNAICGQTIRRMMEMGLLVRIDDAFKKWYGIPPAGTSISTDADRARYKELFSARMALEESKLPSKGVRVIEARMEVCDRKISRLGEQRRTLEQQLAEEKSGQLSPEELLGLEARSIELRSEIGFLTEPDPL